MTAWPGSPESRERPAFAPPTWPSADDLVSDLIPTLSQAGASTAPSLRVGVRAGQVATLRAPGQITALDADGLDALIGALEAARELIHDRVG